MKSSTIFSLSLSVLLWVALPVSASDPKAGQGKFDSTFDRNVSIVVNRGERSSSTIELSRISGQTGFRKIKIVVKRKALQEDKDEFLLPFELKFSSNITSLGQQQLLDSFEVGIRKFLVGKSERYVRATLEKINFNRRYNSKSEYLVEKGIGLYPATVSNSSKNPSLYVLTASFDPVISGLANFHMYNFAFDSKSHVCTAVLKTAHGALVYDD